MPWYQLSETKIKNSPIYDCILKRIKFLGINLTKELKDLYTENCNNIDERQLKKIQINGKIVHAHGLEN